MKLHFVLCLILFLQAARAFQGQFPCYQPESLNSGLVVIQNQATPNRVYRTKADSLQSLTSKARNREWAVTSMARMPCYEELVPISPKFKRNDPLVRSTSNFIDMESDQNFMLPASQFECIEIMLPAVINFDEQLIMPPYPVELPYGLGYLPAAVPLVEHYFAPTLDPASTNLLVPIANDFDYMALAAPLDIDFEYLAKPIIL